MPGEGQNPDLESKMALLSKRLMQAVAQALDAGGDPAPLFLDLKGRCIYGTDPLGVLNDRETRCSYALQESIDRGSPFLYYAAPSVMCWVAALEHQRVIYGSMASGAFRVEDTGAGFDGAHTYLETHGMDSGVATAFLAAVPAITRKRLEAMADRARDVFYRKSGWRPELLNERKQEWRRHRQLAGAMIEMRARGESALYTFEKERELLANIRAGDRNESRRLLNEMLATIYLSAPKPAVLRARLIELLSCLTRAAIEDNPLLEPLIERNHRWTDRLIHAEGFESLSNALMNALDEFIDAVHLHGVNRSNVHVHKALEYIVGTYRDPISLSHVAKHVGLSTYRLAHLVKEFTGNTVLEMIREVRLRRAQELLDQTALTCAEIAYEVGFGDQSYFIRQFKRETGLTPVQYRRHRRPVPGRSASAGEGEGHRGRRKAGK